MKRWEELREELIGWLESSCFDGDPRTWGPDAEKDIDAIIAAVREDERKRIWDAGVTQMVEIETDPHRVFVVNASAVDPKESKAAGIDPKEGATVEVKARE